MRNFPKVIDAVDNRLVELGWDEGSTDAYHDVIKQMYSKGSNIEEISWYIESKLLDELDDVDEELSRATETLKDAGMNVIKEDSLDDFSPSHSVNKTKRWFTITGKIRTTDRSDVERLLQKHKQYVRGSIESYDDFTKSFRVILTCKNSETQIKSALKILLGTEGGCFFLHYKTSNIPMDRPSIYSSEPTKNSWSPNELDRLLQQITF